MTRRISPTLLVAALVALVPQVAAAQRVAPAHLASSTPVVASRPDASRLEASPAVPASDAGVRAAGGGGYFSAKRLTTMIGGSALGAALGYFSSQVRMSDWDDRARSEQGQSLRRHYAWGGAAAGATLGLVVPVGRRPTGIPAGPSGLGRSIITAEEISAASARNAYELVQSLRPRWLVMKEVLTLGQAIGEGGAGRDPSTVSGDYAIIVYMDEAKLGGVETLRDVAITPIRYVRFYNATEATYRWGRGHGHGVIYLSTMDDLGRSE